MSPRANVGYSATPLCKKLGIKEGTRVMALNAPGDYLELVGQLPHAAVLTQRQDFKVDLVHIFVTERAAMAKLLQLLRKKLRADVPVWVSWPKQASKLASDITENTIREVALPLGFVDVKVCAVDAVWSGLKLVVRKELR
jgi:hypothetical protein